MRKWARKQRTEGRRTERRRTEEQRTRRQWVRGRAFEGRLLGLRNDAGSATAEYAIATLAAVGFAGLLVVILRSDAVRQMLTDLIHRALTFAG